MKFKAQVLWPSIIVESRLCVMSGINFAGDISKSTTENITSRRRVLQHPQLRKLCDFSGKMLRD